MQRSEEIGVIVEWFKRKRKLFNQIFEESCVEGQTHSLDLLIDTVMEDVESLVMNDYVSIEVDNWLKDIAQKIEMLMISPVLQDKLESLKDVLLGVKLRALEIELSSGDEHRQGNLLTEKQELLLYSFLKAKVRLGKFVEVIEQESDTFVEKEYEACEKLKELVRILEK